MFITNGDYKVYIHINKTNGKKYVGQTCQTVEKRWQGGKGYIHSAHFYSAIKKYGWDNFEHIVFATGLTQDEANNFEKLLIEKLNTTDSKCGYNLRSGGGNSKHSLASRKKMSESYKNRQYVMTDEHKEKLIKSTSKQVSQFTKANEFIQSFESLSEAERQTGVKAQGISRCCKGKGKSAGGFVWKYITKED